jgi:hypothetical protein
MYIEIMFACIENTCFEYRILIILMFSKIKKKSDWKFLSKYVTMYYGIVVMVTSYMVHD